MPERAVTLPPDQTSEYVCIPSALSLKYLEGVVSRALGEAVVVAGCTATNLCAAAAERVSDSGATILHLALELSGGHAFELVAKILSPDSTNIFKIDRRFTSRRWEVALMRWWGLQSLPNVPVVYDTRADPIAREYWILHEYFPCVGHAAGRMGHADVARLAGHVAALHAYSGERLGELETLLDAIEPGDPRAPGQLIAVLRHAAMESELVAISGLSDAELGVLSACCDAIQDRPAWVNEWDTVCVNRDFSARNAAVRDCDGRGQLVSFDWGAAQLGPAEADLEVLLGRDFAGDAGARDVLVREYLRAYADLTGREIAYEMFMARVPWARLMVELRYIVGHLSSLQWMRWQSRSPFLIHGLVRYAERTLGELHGR